MKKTKKTEKTPRAHRRASLVTASASGSESSSPAASLSSDDSNLEAEMSRLNDGAPGETTLEQFDRAADDDAAAPGGPNPSSTTITTPRGPTSRASTRAPPTASCAWSR